MMKLIFYLFLDYITEALEKHHPSQDFTRNTLVQAGIPEDVVQDAITCL
jgi:hypothetical protein